MQRTKSLDNWSKKKRIHLYSTNAYTFWPKQHFRRAFGRWLDGELTCGSTRPKRAWKLRSISLSLSLLLYINAEGCECRGFRWKRSWKGLAMEAVEKLWKCRSCEWVQVGNCQLLWIHCFAPLCLWALEFWAMLDSGPWFESQKPNLNCLSSYGPVWQGQSGHMRFNSAWFNSFTIGPQSLPSIVDKVKLRTDIILKVDSYKYEGSFSELKVVF